MTERDLLVAERALFEESCAVQIARQNGDDRDLRTLIELARTYWEVAQELLIQELEAEQDAADGESELVE